MRELEQQMHGRGADLGLQLQPRAESELDQGRCKLHEVLPGL